MSLTLLLKALTEKLYRKFVYLLCDRFVRENKRVFEELK